MLGRSEQGGSESVLDPCHGRDRITFAEAAVVVGYSPSVVPFGASRTSRTSVSSPHDIQQDPFRWLERDSEETFAWQAAQNEAADRALRDHACFDELRNAIAPFLARGLVTAPVRRGGHWFRVDTGPLVVADSPTGAGRTLVDPGEASLDWFFPSPLGSRVAYGLSFGGDEQSVLHVVETESGDVLPDRIPFTSNATVAWLPDETGFAVNTGTAPDFERVDKVLVVHRLGQGEPSAREPIEVREPYCVYPQVSGDGRFLVAVTSEVEPRADWIRTLPDGEWRPFLSDVDGTCNGVFDGDTYVAVCTEGAARGRLVRIPIATAALRETWVELLPEGELVLRFVQRAGELLVVGALRDACSVVLVVSPQGRVDEIELPAAGLVSRSASHGVSQPAAANEGTGVAGDDNGFSFVLGAPDRSAGLYRYERAAGVVTELRAPEARFPFVVTRHEATASDGVTVGYEVVHRADLAPVSLPAVVYAYGGWNVALARGSLGANAHLVEAGAAFVLAHIRGGGEEGTGFHRDGALERKQHSYDDLYAVAEDLAARGIADSERIAVLGGSNGGLMVAVALTQRPDLWCAACSLVPVTDMLRYHLSPYGETGLREYGNPDDPADCSRTALLLAVPQRPRGRPLPADPRRRGCERHALPGLARAQARRPAPGRWRGRAVPSPRPRRWAPQHAAWSGSRGRVAGLPASRPRVASLRLRPERPLRCHEMPGRMSPGPADRADSASRDAEERRSWWIAVGVLAGVRVAIPLVTLAFSGHALPGLPSYRFQPLNGDSLGFYSATREFISSIGLVSKPLLLLAALLVVGATAVAVWLWRRSPRVALGRGAAAGRRAVARGHAADPRDAPAGRSGLRLAARVVDPDDPDPGRRARPESRRRLRLRVRDDARVPGSRGRGDGVRRPLRDGPPGGRDRRRRAFRGLAVR